MTTLELSVPNGVSVRELASITEAFAKLYGEIGRGLSAADGADLRMTGHHEGSLVLECEPVLSADADPGVAEHAAGVMLSGLDMLAQGEEPIGFSHKALNHAALFVGSFTTEDAMVTIAVSGRSVQCTPLMQTTARQITNRRSVAWGTVEGMVETVSVHNSRRFNLYELLTGDRIECRFDTPLLDEAKQALGRRALVYGEIHRRGEEIDHLQVDRLEVRPLSTDLPGFDAIRGLFARDAD